LADLILKNYFDPKRKNFRKKIKNIFEKRLQLSKKVVYLYQQLRK